MTDTGAIHVQRLREAGIDPWRVAVHEAGHAVVAWALHVPVKQIELGTFRLWWMTRILVKHHTGAITRLANVLMKEGALDFDRTYAIVSGRMT